MLIFLNNIENKVGFNNSEINENYARELMELHTLGVNGGYTQNDVINVAKILSGLTVSFFSNKLKDDELSSIKSYDDYIKFIKENNKSVEYNIDGFTVFNGGDHDYSDKTILNKKINNSGIEEIDELIDILVNNPSTAYFVSKRLAIYFLNDNPSEDLIKKMALEFLKTKGEIGSVLKVLFLSEDFKENIEHAPIKVKDPYTYFVSVMKSSFVYENLDRNNLLNLAFLLRFISADPYYKTSPDGLPIMGKNWLSTNRLSEYKNYTIWILINHGLKFKKDNIQTYDIDYHLFNLYVKNKIKNEEDLFGFLLSDKWLKR